MKREKLLTVTEACIHLGITKELLYAYIRNAPKKSLGRDRRLISKVTEDGRNVFEVSELDAFDDYLKEPWSEKGDKRPAIPSYIQSYLQTEIEGQCPITKKGAPLENAHIEDYSVSRNHHHHNLIRIAKDEHTKADTGIITKDLLRDVKHSLVELLRQKLKFESGYWKSTVQVPKPHPYFIGRYIELVSLTNMMQENQLVVVEGIGGMGKTQLLLNAIENVRYHNPLIWIDVETISIVNDLVVLISNEVAKIENVRITDSLIDTLSSLQITIALDGIEKLLLSNRDEIEDFIHLILTQASGVQLLITSQMDLSIFDDQKAHIKLEGLSKDHGNQLIVELVGQKIKLEDDDYLWITNFCGGHPLSLKITTALIKFYKSAKKAIEQLKKHDSLKQPLRRNHNKSTALSVCLNTVYDSLTADQKSILHHIKFFPVGVKSQWAEAHLELSNFDDDLATLQQFFFLKTYPDVLDFERLMVENPIRNFLYDCAIEESKTKHDAYEKEILIGISIEAGLINHNYIQTSTNGSPEYGIARMESEIPNILETFHIAQNRLDKNDDSSSKDYEIVAGVIIESVGKFFFVRGNYDLGIQMAKAGIALCLKGENFEEAATQYMYLSQFQDRRFDKLGLQNSILKLSELAQSSKNEYVALCEKWLRARVSTDEGDYDNAINLFNQIIPILKKRIQSEGFKGNNNPYDNAQPPEEGNLALVFSEIGNAYKLAGKSNFALKYYEQCIEIQQEIGDVINAQSCYYNMANCYMDLGQEEKGFEYYFLCLDAYLKQGNIEFAANTMAELGRQIEKKPDIVHNDLLNEDTFKTVWKNVSYRLEEFSKKVLNTTESEFLDSRLLPLGIVGQIVLLTMLNCFSENRHVLSLWAEDIIKVVNLKPNDLDMLHAIINLAHVIGHFEQWKSLTKKEQEKPLETIYMSCLILNGGPDINSQTRIFYWLAQWMKHVGLNNEATAQNQFDQAIESISNDGS